MSLSSWRATGWVSHRELERGCRGCIFNAGSFLQWPATTFVRGGGGGLWREEVVALRARCGAVCGGGVFANQAGASPVEKQLRCGAVCGGGGGFANQQAARVAGRSVAAGAVCGEKK